MVFVYKRLSTAGITVVAREEWSKMGSRIERRWEIAGEFAEKGVNEGDSR